LAGTWQGHARYRTGTPITVWDDPSEPFFVVMDPLYEWAAAMIRCVFLILIAMGKFVTPPSRRLINCPDASNTSPTH
jgi:hypothetical protein